MAESNNIFLKSTAQSLSDMLHRVINNTFIVEYGIIKAIPSTGVVTVEMSVAEKKDDTVITDCILASFASSSITVNITPNIDDKVIVLFPRKFHCDMFQKDKNEPIISEAGTGYNVLTGIAILLNQYQEAVHKNYIDVSDGNLTLKLGYSEDDERNMVELTTDSDGSLDLNLGYNSDEDKSMIEVKAEADGNISVNNAKAFLTVSKDGAMEVKNDVTSITVDKDGGYEIDNGKSKVTVDKNGNVTIDAMSGKVSIKNSVTSLYAILNGMLTILNTSLSTAGSPASHVVVPQQFSTQSTQLGQLMQ